MAKFLREQRHGAFSESGFACASVACKQDESRIGHIRRFQMIIKVVDIVFRMRKKLYDALVCFLLKLVEREQYG